MNSKRSTLILLLLAVGLLAMAATWGGHTPRMGALASPLSMEAPPGVRFVSVALGGFRGLMADVLWVRASSLQDAGKFFEVAQLSDWITRLEPRYPEVWAYHAWNMAYNITAVVSDPADRWHWIKNGIRLLRDEGIPSNPASPKLYWELGWMFYDKVGGRWDESVSYYRIAWAGEITQLLGGGLADYPVLENNPKASQALAAVGLKLDIMKAVDAAYGPLDWRLPETHALYWGYRGRNLAAKDAAWCDRLVWMALTETVKGGALLYQPAQRRYQRGPRVDVAIKALLLCEEAKRRGDPLVELAMYAFLREAALTLYVFQRPGEAEVAFQLLKREKTPDAEGAGSLVEYVRNEAAARLRGLDSAGQERLVVEQLVRSDIWRRLDAPEFAAGYDRLARLYWRAFAKAEPAGTAWQALLQQAGERSVREMPGS